MQRVLVYLGLAEGPGAPPLLPRRAARPYQVASARGLLLVVTGAVLTADDRGPLAFALFVPGLILTIASPRLELRARRRLSDSAPAGTE